MNSVTLFRTIHHPSAGVQVLAGLHPLLRCQIPLLLTEMQ